MVSEPTPQTTSLGSILLCVGFYSYIMYVLFSLSTHQREYILANVTHRPVLQVEARVLIKGQESRGILSVDYVVFELESGERKAFRANNLSKTLIEDYLLLKEGDEGILTFQGIQYIRFSRNSRKIA
jgi:hypothetical protein